MSALLDKMNQQFTDMQKLALHFEAMAEQAIAERDKARERVARLEGALFDIAERSGYLAHCSLPADSLISISKQATNALEGKS